MGYLYFSLFVMIEATLHIPVFSPPQRTCRGSCSVDDFAALSTGRRVAGDCLSADSAAAETSECTGHLPPPGYLYPRKSPLRTRVTPYLTLTLTLNANHNHNHLNGRAPPYLSEHCIPVSSADTRRHLRSTNRHLLAVPRFRLNTYGRRAFSVAGPMAWNSLPDFIRDPTSTTDCFRRT